MVTRTNVADSIEERTERGRIHQAVLESQMSVHLTLTRENPNHHYLSRPNYENQLVSPGRRMMLG